MTERWTRIKGIDVADFYLVSETGKIKNSSTGRILKHSYNTQGYPLFSFRKPGGDKVSRTIHRIVAMSWLPLVDGKKYVNHKDGNKENNFHGNLEWVTHKENIHHAHKTGLCKFNGEGGTNAKLTNSQVREIRENRKQKNNKELASEYGVSSSSIIKIRLGKSYKTAEAGFMTGWHPPSSVKKPRMDDEKLGRIRKMLSDGCMTQKEIAMLNGVGATTVRDIAKGRSWKKK